MFRQRADDLVELAAPQQIDRTPVAEVRIDALEPLACPRPSEDPLGLGEDELESVHACRVHGIRGAAVHPPGDGAPLHSENGRKLRLPSEITCQSLSLHFCG